MARLIFQGLLLSLAGWLVATTAWGQLPEDPGARKQLERKLRRELGEQGYRDYLKKEAEKAAAAKAAATPRKLTPDEEALFDASIAGDLAKVKTLLDKGVSFSIRNQHGETPLGKAAAFGNYDLFDLYLTKGATVNDADVTGTPLWWAASRGDIKRIEWLLAKGADLNKRGQGGSPVEIAADKGHLDVVEFLLAKGADLNKQAHSGSSVELAAIKGHVDLVKLLLAKGCQPGVFTCALLGDDKSLALLLKEKPALGKETSKDVSPLHLATAGGHLAVVELLLANGADIWQKGSDGKMPIELCATLPMFKLYVAKQKDLVQTDQGSILLSLFQSSDRRDLAQYMLDQGGLPRGAAIILAGLDPEKDRDMVNLLVKNGVLTRHSNLGPYAGPTPLDFAIFNMYQVVGTENPFGIDDSGEIVIKRNRPMALWLIANGCPIDLLSGNERRSCPLNKAIEHNEIEIVKALIDKGVNLTPQLLTRNTGGGSTHTEPTRALPPLMVAVDSSLDMMKLLVERGVDVNAADPETGRTPLHWAALRNKRDAAEYLLGEGANPRAKTKAFPPNPGGNGIPPFPGSPAETPSQVAAGRGHTELAAFLKSKE